MVYIRAMSNLAFDTHEFVKELTETGMKAEQAEVLARTYANLLTDRLATKDDIALLKKDIQALEQRFTDRMQAQEERLTGRIDGLQKDMEAQEERLTGQIERSQMRTIFAVTGVLGFLILVLEFYGG